MAKNLVMIILQIKYLCIENIHRRYDKEQVRSE